MAKKKNGKKRKRARQDLAKARVLVDKVGRQFYWICQGPKIQGQDIACGIARSLSRASGSIRSAKDFIDGFIGRG